MFPGYHSTGPEHFAHPSRIGSMTGRPWFCLYLKLLAKTAWLRICLNYDWIRLTRRKVCTKQHLLKPIPQQSFHLGCNWSVERIGGVLLHRVCSISGNRTSGFGWVLVWVKIEGLGMLLYFQNRWPTPKLSVSSSSPKLWLRVAFLLRSLWDLCGICWWGTKLQFLKRISNRSIWSRWTPVIILLFLANSACRWKEGW